MASGIDTVLEVSEYQDHDVRGTYELGTFAASPTKFGADVDATEASFVLEQCIKPFSIDHIDVGHEGVNAAGNTFRFRFFKLPVAVAMADILDDGILLLTTTITGTQPAVVEGNTDGIDEDSRRFARGEKLVCVIDSQDDQAGSESYNSSELALVVLSWLGRTRIM